MADSKDFPKQIQAGMQRMWHTTQTAAQQLHTDFRTGVRATEHVWPKRMRQIHFYTGALVLLSNHALFSLATDATQAQVFILDGVFGTAAALSAVLNRLAHISEQDFAHTASEMGEHPLDHPLLADDDTKPDADGDTARARGYRKRARGLEWRR